jgi:mono/diheme cytochrome c family protein
MRVRAICSLLLLFTTAPFSAAQDEAAAISEADGIAWFETHIRPLLVQRCYSCHSLKAGKQEGGLLLDSPDAWLRGGDQGPAIVVGDPAASLLSRAVHYNDPDLLMPPTERLNDEDIAKLDAWIKMGAPAPATAHANVIENPSDPIAGKSHWAFLPLTRPTAPAVQDQQWARSDIDRFVLAKLESEGLRPVGDATSIDLVRRTCFQLIGLPPTEAQIQQFQELPIPQAMERLVDELLASPQFGQRWGRHWLDLARYADSNGLDENFLFREAWRYRNWVIDSVNADMPFDRFLLEQLAGDLLPYDSLEQRDRQRIAAGFLVVGPKVLLGVNPDRQKMDVADEQLESISRAVLAQTVGCARCHDHKFDPIPTADYYAMAGILTSTKVMEQRYMLGEQRVMERLAGLGEQGDQLNSAYETWWRERPGHNARKEKVKAVRDVLKQADDQAIAARLLSDADGFADAAKDATQPKENRLAAQEALLKELQDLLANPPQIPPRAMMPVDQETPINEAIRIAGKFDAPGDLVPRGFLQVLYDGSIAPLPEKQSGRIELSQWLTDPARRSGQLTARVQANRIWHHLLGRGLVRTVDNFGRTGETPSHPELLDYLASELIQEGWSFKKLIRKIVLSRTFALSSQYDPVNADKDPENILLWRANRRRLDPESLRDAMLSAAGTLELTQMDSTVAYLGDQATAVGSNPVRRRTDYNCRSVYLPVIRNDLPEIFEAFDFTNPHTTTGARPKTTVPTQGLFMLNDTMVMATAEITARRILTETAGQPAEARIQRAFQLIVSAGPTNIEQQAMQAYLQQTETRLQVAGDPEASLKALTLACHALYASSRFQYVE